MAQANFYELAEQASRKLYEPVDDLQSLDQWKADMSTLIDQIAQVKLSSSKTSEKINTSLDPDDWVSASHLAHQMLESSLDLIRYRREQPVWQPIPVEVRSAIETEPLPEKGQPLSNVFHDVLTNVIPYTRGNTHPRFWGWVMGEGTLGGILADMIAATLNINAGGCTHSAALIERAIIHWMRQVFGFPRADHGGLIVNGTSMATVICLATARRQILTNVRQDGIKYGPQLVVYVSAETHMCIGKSLELLGMGSKAMHCVPVDENFAINVNELRKAIEEDRMNGLTPFCIVGNAGMRSILLNSSVNHIGV